MLKDEDYINWLKTTYKLINKYNLRSLKVDIKTMHPFNEIENRIKEKDMVHIKILDNHKFIIEDKTYDILEGEYDGRTN